jgi:AraC-like DNA-binding protein
MKLAYQNIEDNGSFVLTNFQCAQSLQLLGKAGYFKIIWCQQQPIDMVLDGYNVTLLKNQVLFATPVHVIEIPVNQTGLTSFMFNKKFYCVHTNDLEVSCTGLLFYGANHAPIVTLNLQDQQSFKSMLFLFEEEFNICDAIQGEMLRTMLKRMLIKSTKLIKKDLPEAALSDKQVDLIRKFNMLVELHFKEKHQVTDYAALLNKSPKTLSNFFKKHKVQSPLKTINERIAIEAKRLLRYSGKTAEEIAYELGYNEASHFSKFFKKQIGVSPLGYRKRDL